MFVTKHLNLTKEQKERGVIYSSQLIVTNNPKIDSNIIHEVYKDDPDAERKIKALKDVSFFKYMAEEFGYDVINEVRR